MGQEIDVHAGAAGLQIVVCAARLVDDLPPHAGILVGSTDKRLGEVVGELDQTSPIGEELLGGRQQVADLDESHGKPAKGASPDVGGATSRLVCPRHLLGLVPSVEQQAATRVQGVFIGQVELEEHFLCRRFQVTPTLGVLDQEGAIHVQSIEPDLVGVDLLVPVSAAWGAGMVLEFLPHEVHRLLVALVMGIVVQVEEVLAGSQQVPAVGTLVIPGHRAVGHHELLHPFRYPVLPLRMVQRRAGTPDELHGDAKAIVVLVQFLVSPRHQRKSHLFGQFLVLGHSSSLIGQVNYSTTPAITAMEARAGHATPSRRATAAYPGNGRSSAPPSPPPRCSPAGRRRTGILPDPGVPSR